MTFREMPQAPAPDWVRCPVCLRDFQLSQATELIGPANEPAQDRLPGEPEDARRERLERVRRICPGSPGPMLPGRHALPYRYDDPYPIVLVSSAARLRARVIWSRPWCIVSLTTRRQQTGWASGSRGWT
jgi:hypothetical protein